MTARKKVADEHQTGVWIWHGRRVTEMEWKARRKRQKKLNERLADTWNGENEKGGKH